MIIYIAANPLFFICPNLHSNLQCYSFTLQCHLVSMHVLERKTIGESPCAAEAMGWREDKMETENNAAISLRIN